MLHKNRFSEIVISKVILFDLGLGNVSLACIHLSQLKPIELNDLFSGLLFKITFHIFVRFVRNEIHCLQFPVLEMMGLLNQATAFTTFTGGPYRPKNWSGLDKDLHSESRTQSFLRHFAYE